MRSLESAIARGNRAETGHFTCCRPECLSVRTLPLLRCTPTGPNTVRAAGWAQYFSRATQTLALKHAACTLSDVWIMKRNGVGRLYADRTAVFAEEVSYDQKQGSEISSLTLSVL
jgi:hypothetical protein